MFRFNYYKLMYQGKPIGYGISLLYTLSNGTPNYVNYDFSEEVLSACHVQYRDYIANHGGVPMIKRLDNSYIRESEHMRMIKDSDNKPEAIELSNPNDLGFLLDILGRFWGSTAIKRGSYELDYITFNGVKYSIIGLNFNLRSLYLESLSDKRVVCVNIDKLFNV